MFTVEFPWAEKALSPNGRVHWATKARATKTAKTMAAALTYIETKGRLPWPRVRLEWVFHPKTANAVDLDNLIASAKAYQDGIALAVGIDDSLFDSTYQIGQVVKGGLVRVTLSKPEFLPL